MILRIAKLTPQTDVAVGATLGERHSVKVRTAIAERAMPAGEIVIMDFEGVITTNASYLKATTLWLLLCGQLWARPTTLANLVVSESSPRPYDVYCVLANIGGEVKDEIREFFVTRQIPILVAQKWNFSGVHSAVLHGQIEPILKRTLSILTDLGAATAPDLHAKYPGEKVTVTAWNNRLADLHALRLVKRERDGKQWVYKPIAKKVIYG